MRLGKAEQKKILTPKTKKRLYHLGLILFVAGLVLMAMSFRALPVLKMPLEHLDVSFTASFLMIPSGAILMMIARMYYKLGYIVALLVFLLSTTGLAHFHMESYRTTTLDRCCEMFVEGGGCVEDAFPENFVVETEEKVIDCKPFLAEEEPILWRTYCNC